MPMNRLRQGLRRALGRRAAGAAAPHLGHQLSALRLQLAQPGVDRVILTPQVVGAGARPLDEVLRGFGDQILARL